MEEQISQYVSSITLPAKHEALARWQVPVCIVAAGLPRAGSDFVRQHLSQVARDSGVALAPQECSPNFLVVVTPEPEELLKRWWAEDHGLFNRDRGIGGVKRMIDTPQPVRIWHNVCSAPPGLPREFQMRGTPDCNKGAMSGSRLSWSAVRAIYSAIVVVDLADIEGLTYGQVADYIALVGLAQIRENPELGDASTILCLFVACSAPKPQGLSTWDRSFLTRLYDTTSSNVMQISQIKTGMGQDLIR